MYDTRFKCIIPKPTCKYGTVDPMKSDTMKGRCSQTMLLEVWLIFLSSTPIKLILGSILSTHFYSILFCTFTVLNHQQSVKCEYHKTDKKSGKSRNRNSDKLFEDLFSNRDALGTLSEKSGIGYQERNSENQNGVRY